MRAKACRFSLFSQTILLVLLSYFFRRHGFNFGSCSIFAAVAVTNVIFLLLAIVRTLSRPRAFVATVKTMLESMLRLARTSMIFRYLAGI